MKKVEAFVRHEAFEPIRMELLYARLPSLSIMEVKARAAGASPSATAAQSRRTTCA